MSSNSSAEAISLPQGGGALSGIGEKFSPDLFTGTGNFTVPIALPPGRNGFQPQLNLVYSTGNGNSPFGLGWNLSIPGVSRKTSDGVPLYNEAEQELREGLRRDVFILSGAEDLVPVSDSYPGKVIYRPRTEGLFARITHYQTPDPDLHNYWRVESKDGLTSLYGSVEQVDSNPAVLTKPGDGRRIFAWKLTETRDPFDNLIRYAYERDAGERGNQLLLKRIQYVDYGDPVENKFLVQVEFIYEERPDPFSDYRAGFEIRTTRRCTAIKVSTHTENDDKHSVREYRFTYVTAPSNGVSLLQQLDIIGFDDDNHPYQDDDGTYSKQLPPLTFGYTQFEPKKRRFDGVEGRDLPARALGAAEMDLLDLHGSGLPDILEMNGMVRYWRNLGNGRFDIPRPMQETPALALADPGVQMIDANGDGRMDMLVTSGPLAGYYPLTHDAKWDRDSFQPYPLIPSFSLDDPEVRLVDLDGDGYTDVLRSGSRLECFFNHPDRRLAWKRTNFAPRQTLDAFPNVNFSDPRVKFADMTGDTLQDIVLVHDGSVEYWPNLGHNKWGRRLSMGPGPRFPYGYDPRRILVGDVDGDGLADIIYVDNDQVMLWLNHSGNGWSEAPIVISGTPPVTDVDNLRLVDLYGTGVSGVLWSSDATGLNRDRLMFLYFTGGQKPYVLNEMDNHMGAITRVEYQPSTHYYLEDQKQPSTRWRTPLPFPVQVVARVEVIDAISKGKLTTEYRYHHGYWDGTEREFRGFGMVEQLDTETFEDYHAAGLHGDTSKSKDVLLEHFSPPILTKTWFHQGPVGEEYGDWEEVDYTHEYWIGDPQLLDHTGRVNTFLNGYSDRGINRMPSPGNRRIKRDALRVLRGSILRTELYAQDGSDRASRPYTVTEHAYNLREIAEPPVAGAEGRKRIFFPHLVAQRTTQWERGDDPMTQFAFTNDYDEFGQPGQQTAVDMPRRASKRLTLTAAVAGEVQPDEINVLATHTRTAYATPPEGKYIHDRVARTSAYEFVNPPSAPDAPDDDLLTVLRKQWIEAQRLRDRFQAQQPGTLRVFSHTVNHYDGNAFEGLSMGELGDYGALVRSEVLVLTEEILRDAYGDPGSDRRPSYLGGTSAILNAPPDFGSRTGYRPVNASAEGYLEGWYIDSQRQQFDFQAGAANPRGLVVAMRDALGNETRIEDYEHQLLPTRVRDAAGMETTAEYNYRVLQPARMTDPNGTRTQMVYSPIGLPLLQFVRGTDAQDNETLGGTAAQPEIRFRYDFLNFERDGKPVFVCTTRRIHHASDNRSDDTIASREYSDGYGRLIQTRAQAEEWIFGETGDDVGLSVQPGVDPSPAIAQRVTDSVVVSGWQVFDNKGRVIEKYEPFFSQGFNYEPEAIRGQHATMFYDPRGNVIRTLTPDGSQQRVILGRPQNPLDLVLDADDLTALDVPDSFEPTPWETYTYDANDLAPLCVAPDDTSLATRAPTTHHFTPGSGLIDALGRVLCQVQRNGSDPGNDWFLTRTDYDLRGNALKIIDAHDRDAFKHSFDLLNRPLRVESIDAGLRTSVLDAQGNLIEYRDSKGSLARRTYDTLNRPKELWARNDTDGRFTLRERIHYGDEEDQDLARQHNTLGKPVQHYDEAGLLETPEYDFKGNLLEKSRRTIRDDALANGWQAEWETPNGSDALEATDYQTSSRYDALNRPTEVTYPQDVAGQRQQLIPRYNRAGALEAVALDDADYVQRIAYNAKGQRVLIAYGNGVMTRHTYDEQTFRLARLRTEGFTRSEDGAANTQTWRGSGQVLQDFSYRYDLAGNITAIDERVPDCGVLNSPEGRDRLLRNFSYDPIYRLLSATGRASNTIGVPRPTSDDPRGGFYAGGAANATQTNAPELTEGYTENFTYDPAGNMLELSYQAASGNWNRVFGMADLPNDRWREASNNRLTSLANGGVTQSYLFDANGNLIQQNNERYHTWDHADRMIGFRVQAGPNSPASIEASYLYGADGMRVKKWGRNQQLQVNTTVYVDGAFEHHRQGDGAENNTLHVMDNQSRIALVRVGAALDGRDVSPQVQYHLGDHLGSSHVVVGGGDAASNSLINREEYFPYGETSFGSFGKKRYRYSGKERDEESGLYYYGARYYAAGLGRWVSCDPAQQKREHVELGIQAYAYAANRALVLIDPDGQETAWYQTIDYGRVSSRQGPRRHPITGASTKHGGMDLTAPEGTSVRALGSGFVESILFQEGWKKNENGDLVKTGAGGYVVIDHGNGLKSLYMHLNVSLVSPGQQIAGGQEIAYSGNTGGSTGPHLHLELRQYDENGKNYVALDPEANLITGDGGISIEPEVLARPILESVSESLEISPSYDSWVLNPKRETVPRSKPPKAWSNKEFADLLTAIDEAFSANSSVPDGSRELVSPQQASNLDVSQDLANQRFVSRQEIQCHP